MITLERRTIRVIKWSVLDDLFEKPGEASDYGNAYLEYIIEKSEDDEEFDLDRWLVENVEGLAYGQTVFIALEE